MKNNLFSSHWEKSSNMDETLLTYNDILELIMLNKIQKGDFDEFVEEMITALNPECEETDNCCCCCCCDDCHPNDSVIERFPFENNSSEFLCAGYTDCMDEAIKYLVEVEKISPEQPIIRNLKAHLENSKERILHEMTHIDCRINSQNNWRHLSHRDDINDCSSIDQSSIDLKYGINQEFSYHHKTQHFPIYTQLATL